MLNRSQLITLFGLAKRGQGPFPRIYRDMRKYLVTTGNKYFNPTSEIAKLLHHIAYGNLVEAKKMLDANPGLVLQAGHVETPSGLKVLHTTPLECALGAGDPEMAEMIASYFDKLDGGEKVRDDQFARFRQHIADMLNAEKNPPYDFTLIIETLMAATPEDVTAALKLDMSHESALRDVLEKFRKDFTPGTITKGMHFNYLHLLRSFEVYKQKRDYLYKGVGNDPNKLQLFCCQVIGFIQRSLPAIDRMIFAQGLDDVVENKFKIERSFMFKYDIYDFPVTAGDSSSHGLGYSYWAGFHGMRGGWLAGRAAAVEKLMSSKNFRLAELMQPRREEKTSRCVML